MNQFVLRGALISAPAPATVRPAPARHDGLGLAQTLDPGPGGAGLAGCSTGLSGQARDKSLVGPATRIIGP